VIAQTENKHQLTKINTTQRSLQIKQSKSKQLIDISLRNKQCLPEASLIGTQKTKHKQNTSGYKRE
jgi:hypothetical protein